MTTSPAIIEEYSALFAPKTVAVLGASVSGKGPANDFIRRLRAFDYAGAIYPIHRTATHVEGLAAYRTLAETPYPVDYAYIAIAAEHVPEALASAHGRVRFAQVMSSGFGETNEGRELERRLVEVTRAQGMRIIGPNCLGTHSTTGRLTFIDNADATPGPIGILSQSGGLSVDILRRGGMRGLRFSRLVTLGNCADVGPNELLDYLLADTQTKVIGLYLESLTDGRTFFECLRGARTRKPVVILKGGRTAQGQRAAASHTGTLASDDRLWVALARQTGSVLVDTLEGFLDSLLALQCLTLHPTHSTQRVVLFGNGGGTSVLGADCLQRFGFELPPLDIGVTSALHDLKLPAGSSVHNPIDTPASALRAESGGIAGKILDAVELSGDVDALIMHLNVTVLLGYRDLDLLGHLMRAAMAKRGTESWRAHFLLVLRSDGDPVIEDAKRGYRRQGVIMGIPVFDEIANAAQGLAALRVIESFRLKHLPSDCALT